MEKKMENETETGIILLMEEILYHLTSQKSQNNYSSLGPLGGARFHPLVWLGGSPKWGTSQTLLFIQKTLHDPSIS